MNKQPLLVTHPVFINEWFQEMNGSITPDKFTLGSGKKVWWKCNKGKDHIWKAIIASRTSGVGCPFCSNKRISTTNSLDKQFPLLVVEWHPTKNGTILPKDVTFGSNRRYWWKCLKANHEWQTSITNRARRKLNCPFCSNQRVSETNNVLVMRPDLAQQWHPTKNKKLLPKDVVYGSNWHIWW